MTTKTEPSLVGHIVGDYQLVSELGMGGMGMVYRAVHRALGQVVAIKSLLPEHTRNKAQLRRFEKEALAMARLQHPGIVQLLGYMETDLGAFIVMEFVEGQDLADLLDRAPGEPPRLEPIPALELAIPALRALQFAHEQGIVHRDLKPANVMRTHGGVVKLMDFGTASFDDGREKQTMPGTTLGTPPYMPPEQVMGKEIVPQTDLYAFAVLVFELLTGNYPLWDDDGNRFMLKILKEAPASVRDYVPGLPVSLEAALAKNLAKAPRDRDGSAAAFADALAAVLAELRPPVDTQTLAAPPEAADAKPVTADAVGVPSPRGFEWHPGWVAAAAGAGVGALTTALPLAVSGHLALGAALGVGLAAVSGVALLCARPRVEPAAHTLIAPGPCPSRAAVWSLELQTGLRTGERVALPQTAFTLGRAADASLPLEDACISSNHARIDFYEGGYWVTDTGSRNGSYLNGHRVSQTLLQPGDVLQLGGASMIVRVEGGA